MRKTYYNPNMDEKDDTWIAGLIVFTILIILFFVDNPFNEPLIKWGICLLGIVIGGSIIGFMFAGAIENPLIPLSLAGDKWNDKDERDLGFLATVATIILMMGGIIGFFMIAVGGIIGVVEKLI